MSVVCVLKDVRCSTGAGDAELARRGRPVPARRHAGHVHGGRGQVVAQLITPTADSQ